MKAPLIGVAVPCYRHGEFVQFVAQYAAIVESGLINHEHATYCVVCRPTDTGV